MSTASIQGLVSAERVKLALFGIFGLAFLALAIPAFAEPMTFWTGIVLGDYAYSTHELHHFVLGTVFPILLLGIIAQVFRPQNRVGALHTAITIWVLATIMFTAAGAFSEIFILLFALLLGMAITHPAGRDQLPSINEVQRPMAVIALITAIVGLVMAGIELNYQLTLNDAHVRFDHYVFMATAWASIAILSMYGSLRGIGWRYPVYAATILLAVIGLGSVLYPGAEQGSSLGVAVGAVVFLWAILFIIIAERGDALLNR